MTSKPFENLLLFSIFGIAMWFFGNLYEAIVLGPNMLSDSVQKMQAWRTFFTVTNPLFFYIPLPQIATITLVTLLFKARKDKVKRLMKRACIFQIASVILTMYIVTQINTKLFFADFDSSALEIPCLAILWNILNITRVLLVGIALTYSSKAYIQTQKE